MCIPWRYRLVMSMSAALLLCFLGCDAQLHNEAQSGKLVYARGNHWAVGHLMGKKSVDEMLNSDERDVDAQAYFLTAESDTQTQPSLSVLKALFKALAGPIRETEDERERRERWSMLRRRWAEQREKEEVNKVVYDVYIFIVH
ncbi:gastrin-releasing peptide precursor [Silurus asotus]|uniref:Gastrin-releasing peptide n=1 Tax=Silurus asotus TaxID=30991 RepID=A0AAD5AAJ8_SILAS|nr:gastrin-releasing peptide precursor [Silurus asotus]